MTQLNMPTTGEKQPTTKEMIGVTDLSGQSTNVVLSFH